MEIEGYKDGDQYVVALLDDERDELYLNVFGDKTVALATCKRIAAQYPNASWSVDL